MPTRLAPGHFFADVARASRCAGLVLTETRHAAARRIPEHGHALAYFCLLLDGGYWERYGPRTVRYDTPSIAYHPPGEEHHGEISRVGGVCFNIEMEPAWLARVEPHLRLPTGTVDARDGELVWLGLRAHREFRRADACTPLALEGLVLELLATAARTRERGERQAPAWLARVMARLEADFQQPLAVSGLAAEAGVHPVHLARVFRRAHGRTIGEHVRRLRIRYACRRLAEPDASLADVALAAGFADQSHFGRVFHEMTGLTPGQYRVSQGEKP